MNRRRLAHRGVLPHAVSLLIALPTVAAGLMTGITGYSGKVIIQGEPLYCSDAGTGCHVADNGARAPVVSFDGPTQVDPGGIATYTFVVTSQNPQVQIQAGLDVAASGGTLGILPDQQEQKIGAEITHTGPKSNDANGVTRWQFTWTAPTTPGSYVLFGAGNSVDGSSTVDGDAAALTSIMVAVGDVPATPTPTATVVPNACAGDCNGNGSVAINELVSSVNISLGLTPIGACSACDTNHDGMVSVSELISAVNKALKGC